MKKIPPRTLLGTSAVDTPVIKFEAGEATNDWINIYGETISSRDELHEFLSKDSGRPKPEFEDLETPEIVDDFLLNYAKITELVQNNFVPPSGMKVYQIAGTGIETPSTMTYFSDRECVSRSLFICTEYRPKVGYRVEMTIDGDETVLVPSGLSMSVGAEVERRWLNLFEYNDDFFDRRHRDILEVPDVYNFVLNTIQSTTTIPYEYLSESAPYIEGGKRLVFQLHSPLDMSIVTSSGQEVSSSTVEIDGAVYRRYGELQYISVPVNEDINLVLNGLATGSFTLDIEEIDDKKIVKRHTYSAIPSSTTTKAVVGIVMNTPVDELTIEVDYDGDGIDDVFYNTEGIIEDEVTYDDLIKVVNDLNLKRLPKSLLLKVVRSAKMFHEKSLIKNKYKRQEEASLRLLGKQVLLFERLRLISSIERKEIEEIIAKLLIK